MSSTPAVREGTATFEHPSLPRPCSTWYQIFGNPDQSSTGRPLVLLHGGPGACHNYLQPFRELAYKHGMCIIFYDQIGCGNSTRYREKKLDTAFWTIDLFTAELQNLLVHLKITEFDILGQSWGGMFGSELAIGQLEGLHKLIIANSPASMKLWVQACNEWRAELPQEVEETLEKYERLQDYENQAYKDAVLFFYKRHMCLVRGENGAPFPDYVVKSFSLLEEDDTVYFTMNGPSEFTVIGSLKTWTVEGRLRHIKVPTLVYNGERDEAKAVCVKPFADEIPGAIWKTIPDTSHMSHVEKPEEICQMVADFLKSNA